jgi:hypothetical protein
MRGILPFPLRVRMTNVKTATATAKANTGILRCAQNDDVKQAMTTAKTRATAKADPLRDDKQESNCKGERGEV